MATGLLPEELFFNVLQGSLMHLDPHANDHMRRLLQKLVYRGKEAVDALSMTEEGKDAAAEVDDSTSLVDWHEFVAISGNLIAEAYEVLSDELTVHVPSLGDRVAGRDQPLVALVDVSARPAATRHPLCTTHRQSLRATWLLLRHKASCA